jgi:hypothetical protein
MVMPLPVPRLTIDMLDDVPEDGTRYERPEGGLLVREALRGSGATVVGIGAIQRAKHTQLDT